MKVQFRERDKRLRFRLEELACAEHLLSGKGRPCDRPISLFCGSCLKPITVDQIEYDEPFTVCPHGCGHGTATYLKRCDVHQIAWDASRDPSICPSCGKDHPNPSGRCFFICFYSDCCREEMTWNRKEKKYENVIECIKSPPQDFVDWLEKRFLARTADDDDKFVLLMIDAYENWRGLDMARMSKEVKRNYASGRRTQISIKRPHGRWKHGDRPRSD